MMLTKRGEFESKWLLYALISANTEHQIKCVEYGAAQPCFNISDAKEFVFACPPSKEEQAAVATYIENECGLLNELVEKALISIKLLKERRSALITAIVTGQIDVSGFVPEGEVAV